MASRVPYSGAPTVAPQDRPLPYRQEVVPVAAFGGASAVAEEHLGDVLSKSGDELFQRAYALQSLDQQARATQASADYETQLGSLHANYTTLQGKNAVDGYQPYVDSVNALRDQVRGTLGSPFAQRAFDQESRLMQVRAIWSGSSHLAEQQQKFVLGASQARIDSMRNYSFNTPQDEDSFQASVDKTRSEMAFQGHAQGWSDDRIKMESDNFVSQLAATRIQGMTKSQPFTAQKLLDKYIQDGLISGSEAGRMTDYVRNERYTVGARQESSNILSGQGWKFGESIINPDRAREAVGGVESSGVYNIIHPPAKNGDFAIGRYGIMNNNLQSWLKEAGMPSMTAQEFAQDKDAQDKLFDFKFGQYQTGGGSFNAAVRRWFTGTYSPKAGASDGHTTIEQYLTKANATLARTASGTEIGTIMRNRAEELSPGDNGMADTFEQHGELQHYRELRQQEEDERNSRQTVANAMLPGKDGKIPTSIEELTKDPDVASAWRSMKPTQQQAYLNVMRHNAKEGGYAQTDENIAAYNRFLGMAVKPDRSPEELQEFLNQDFTTMAMPNEFKSTLVKLQMRLGKDISADPQMGHAMGVLRQTLSDAGIDNSKGNRDSYNQFWGALHNVMQAEAINKGGKLNDDDITKIGNRLIADTTQLHGIPGFRSAYKYYEVPVPPEARDIITKKYSAANGGSVPDEATIHNIYIARQYQLAFGKKQPQSRPTGVPSFTSSPSKPKPPEVPVVGAGFTGY